MGCSSRRSPSPGPRGDPTMDAGFEWSKSPSPCKNKEVKIRKIGDRKREKKSKEDKMEEELM